MFFLNAMFFIIGWKILKCANNIAAVYNKYMRSKLFELSAL